LMFMKFDFIKRKRRTREETKKFNIIIQWTHNVMDGHVGALKFHWLLPAMPANRSIV
jgi:hypothetical protein